MNKYDGIAKADAVVTVAEKHTAKPEKKSNGVVGLAVRIACAAALVAVPLALKNSKTEPLERAAEYFKRAVCYDMIDLSEEEAGYSVIAEYFKNEDESV